MRQHSRHPIHGEAGSAGSLARFKPSPPDGRACSTQPPLPPHQPRPDPVPHPRCLTQWHTLGRNVFFKNGLFRQHKRRCQPAHGVWHVWRALARRAHAPHRTTQGVHTAAAVSVGPHLTDREGPSRNIWPSRQAVSGRFVPAPAPPCRGPHLLAAARAVPPRREALPRTLHASPPQPSAQQASAPVAGSLRPGSPPSPRDCDRWPPSLFRGHPAAGRA